GYGVLRLGEVRPGWLRAVAAFIPDVTHRAIVASDDGVYRTTPLGVWCCRGGRRCSPTETAPTPERTGTASRCRRSRSWPASSRRPHERGHAGRRALGDPRRRPPCPRRRRVPADAGRVPGHVLGEPRPGAVAAHRDRPHLPPGHGRALAVPGL